MPEDEQRPASPIADWGLASAAAVVERMLELGRATASGLRLPFPVNGGGLWPPGVDGRADGPTNGADPVEALDPEERARQARNFRADAERMVELYADWTRFLIDGAASLAEQATGEAPTAGESARPDGGSTAEVLVLGPASPGATTSAVAWLHVLDGPAAAPAPLHASDLHAHDGGRVKGSAVRCSPDHLDTSIARTSAEVRVTVKVPKSAAPGTYHGHLLATGLPEVVLPVRLEVVA